MFPEKYTHGSLHDPAFNTYQYSNGTVTITREYDCFGALRAISIDIADKPVTLLWENLNKDRFDALLINTLNDIRFETRGTVFLPLRAEWTARNKNASIIRFHDTFIHNLNANLSEPANIIPYRKAVMDDLF